MIEISVETDVSFNSYISGGKLGRHETFTPRYGWLKKGYDGVLDDGNIFKATDAIEKLGVGKNMVRSIRYWCQAFKVIEEKRNREMAPTELGRRLLDDKGWDPYLEDVATLWLLHWQLFVPPLEAVSWSLAFNKCHLWSFDSKQLGKLIFNNARKHEVFASRSEKTFHRDASCIIRMYRSGFSEAEIDCPFTQLGLIHRAEGNNAVYFEAGAKQSLPPLIFAAACFSYMSHYVPSGPKTISLYRLAHGDNSPGVVFKAPESAVGDYLYRAQMELDGFSLNEVMGSQQLHFEKDTMVLYWAALQKYYSEQ